MLLRRIGTSDPGNEKNAAGTPANNTPAVPGGLTAIKERAAAAEDRPMTNQRDRNEVPMSKQEKILYEFKQKVQEKLVAEIERKQISSGDERQVKSITEDIFNEVLATESMPLTRQEKGTLLDAILAEILGFGPIQALLGDDTISEIMINGPKQVFIEKKGKLIKTDVTFQNDQHVMRIIDRIVSPLGRRVDESSPMVDARLPDGSRVNVVIPPISLVGPVVTIRKFNKKPLTIDDLIRFGSMSRQTATFLEACVKGRLNIVVAGGTGSGKTTLLNVLSGFIPDDERIITVENAAELQLRQEHVITLESKSANIEGKGEVSIRDLVINCLRMRPERIVVGECRGGETLDMLQAMNTGHDGSLTTLHANSPKDALSRIETMCMMAGMDLPIRAIRDQVANAVNVIVQQSRMQDGSRRVVSIAEVDGMEGDIVRMQEIFRFEQTGIDENKKVVGSLKPTGVVPKFIEQFETHHIFLPSDTFGSANQLRAF